METVGVGTARSAKAPQRPMRAEAVAMVVAGTGKPHLLREEKREEKGEGERERRRRNGGKGETRRRRIMHGK
jgi:hypothetical protein